MIDIKEINEEIEKLENSKTSHDTCFKLSYLYTVKDHLLKDQSNNIVAPTAPIEEPSYIQGAKILTNMDSPLTEVKDYTPMQGDLTFCNLVKTKGNKKILSALSLYMQHLRAYKPSEYSRLMDKLSNC